MAKKKTPGSGEKKVNNPNVMGLHAAVVEQPITDTLEQNYMPYAMSVIVSRAIPEIDGFKPSHRKLLYTMYKMGLLTGGRTKSANIVGQTMRLNPHGDQAIYETMVRLAKGNESLLHPFVDSKGNFGKVYSRDMAYAASRYTEAKLAPICAELFRDLDCDAVDFVDNYDNSMKEPSLLPTTFPNVLVSANQGIAVGMASQICGFNLGEVCDTTVALLKNPDHDIASTLLAPDFPTGGQIICDPAELRELYRTGRGGVKVRSRWRYDKQANLIEIYEIPYSTSIEAILDKVAELIKAGKISEISDMRDETDLSGLKLAIDLKRGADPEKLMTKLFRLTPLQDTVSCNFNILIAGMPRVMGVGEILNEWTAWRTECVRRRVYFVLNRKKDKLHLLLGLKRILLDIDKAIAIIRETEEEAEVIPNLMIGFGIDQVQAEYVAEIKLRNINKEYILKRVQETEDLQKEIADLEDTLQKPARIRKIIVGELEQVRKKYAVPRRTELLYGHEVEEYVEDDQPEDYPVTVFLSREGDFKKITPAEQNKTMFTRIVGAIFYPGGCYAVYNTRNAAMKWNGMGEFKALHSLTELARMNAGVQSIDSAILLGESYDTALTTLLESDKNRRLELRFDGIYRHIYFVPMNAGGIRQFKLLTVPDWKEKLLELLFDPDVRSYNRGFMEYDASIGGTCVFSHLDGDIARLIRFREAMQTGAGSFEVLCFDDQAPFLREYLGPYITLKTIDAATVEAELGL